MNKWKQRLTAGYHRLPKVNWRPRKLMRPRLSNWSARLEQLTGILLRLGLLALIVFLFALLYRIFAEDGYMVEAFSVPKNLEEQGYRGEIVARKVQDELLTLKQLAATVKADSLQLSGEQPLELNLAVMGVGFSLRSMATSLREIFGRSPKTIRGEITRTGSQVQLTLRMTGYAPQQYALSLDTLTEAVALQRMFRVAGELVLLNTDPYRMALVYRQEQRYDKAMYCVRRILSDRPSERHWAYLAWGAILEDQQQWESALDKYRRITELEPDFEPAYLRYARCLNQLERPEEALTVGRKLASFKSIDAENWANIGWIYHHSGAHAAADSAFERASKLAPNNVGVWLSWGESKFSRNDLDDVMPIVERIEALEGETSFGYVARAMQSMVHGDTAKAEAYMFRAFEMDPANVAAVNSSMGFAYNKKDYQRVVAIAAQADLRNMGRPMRRHFYNFSAMANNQIGQHDSAFVLVKKAIALDPVNGYPYSTLAETFAFIGKPDSFYHYIQLAFEKGIALRDEDLNLPPYTLFRDDARFQQILQHYQPKVKG